jgi:hypothetical protein
MYELTNVYKISILARRALDSSTAGRDYVVEHEPFILHAESIDAAERDAESLAFTRWKKEDGWQDHEAYIAPTTRDDYKTITGTEIRGPIFGRIHEPKTVKFS